LLGIALVVVHDGQLCPSTVKTRIDTLTASRGTLQRRDA
jgi:hypothetical protein